MGFNSKMGGSPTPIVDFLTTRYEIAGKVEKKLKRKLLNATSVKTSMDLKPKAKIDQ